MRVPIRLTTEHIGIKLIPGDFISSEAGTWVARACPNCLGSGLVSYGYPYGAVCPRCEGLKVIWAKVTNVTTTDT